MFAALSFAIAVHQDAPQLPEFPREFRAVWVATVDNIDWPSKRTLSANMQKAEMIRILDLCKSLKLNAVVFQIRPAADALYESKYEPWSEYLTNRQGRAPSPFYDPLAFAVEEAHKRGLELHAWFNPYRAKHPTAKGPLARNHVAHEHPEGVKSYDNMLWMDPGVPVVREHTLSVFEDVVRRYDVDGVHIDDYFYPYPVKGKPFPDDASYAKYGAGMSRSDWRRNNVNQLVSSIYQEVKKIKPWVKVGISPFGVYRPGYPATIKASFDQYEALSADPLLWLQKGWCDYLTPQLYWSATSKALPYADLLSWWESQNTLNRHLWPGLYTSRIMPQEAKDNYSADEIPNQIAITRASGGATGHVHFSMKPLMINAKGVADKLRGGTYTEDALVPASPWLSKEIPLTPGLVEQDGTFTWSPKGDVSVFAVWEHYGSQWILRAIPGIQTKLTPEPSLAAGKLDAFYVATVDRYGNMSKAVAWSASK